MAKPLQAEIEWEGLSRGADMDSPAVCIKFNFGELVKECETNGWYFEDKTAVDIAKAAGYEDLPDLNREEIEQACKWFNTREASEAADTAASRVYKDWLEAQAPEYDGAEHRMGKRW